MGLLMTKLESLAEYITLNLLPPKMGADYDLVKLGLESWFSKNMPEFLPKPDKFFFEVIALYDKGFGPECMNLPNIESEIKYAQSKAEELATTVFNEKFKGKVEWEEIKIRPVK
jgi:hypothetical protein